MTQPPPKKTSALDSRLARISALFIALSALALMGWLGREDVPFVRGMISGVSGQPAPRIGSTSNPELSACLAQRVGDVEKMQSDNIINEKQYAAFKSRAISYCQAQFPGSQ